MTAGLSRAWLVGLTAGLLSGCSAIDALHPPAVLDIVRTIDNKANITTQDYEQLEYISNLVFQQIRDIDPQIQPQLQLQSSTNFIDEIRQQTESGFGPDLIITDSETALALYRSRLIDPIQLSEQDRQDTPQSLLDLVTAKNGALVARPVNQFVQLACFNKERLPTAPRTLEDMKQSSSDATFGMAIQLKDLFWSTEAFDAGPALKAAMDSSGTSQVDYETVTAWLSWLVDSSYQQNIRFLNNQGNLRDGLIRGELDWITCWSNNLRGLKLKLGDRLGVTALPKGPNQNRTATTRLEVWALGLNSSPLQRRKALLMVDFVTKPWAQKTYSLTTKNSMPVSQKAATVVASKIPGGNEALRNYVSAEGLIDNMRVKARIFRDPVRYEIISDALLDTIYDIQTPEQGAEQILQGLREKR
jgi:arabinogalactan oligomer/maltooligosaccharide transport system substrate-binding protein